MKVLKVLKEIGFWVVLLVLTAICAVLILLFGWIWPVQVIRGKIKLGPRESWDDTQARSETKVRRLELKMAASVTALYVIATFFAFVFISAPMAGEPRAMVWNVMIGIALAMLVTAMLPGSYLGMIAPLEKERIEKKLKQRLMNPVLF